MDVVETNSEWFAVERDTKAMASGNEGYCLRWLHELWLGWRSGIFRCLWWPLGPLFEPRWGHYMYVDWFFWVPYGLCGYSRVIILWGFPPTSKTETSFLVFSLLGSWWVQLLKPGSYFLRVRKAKRILATQQLIRAPFSFVMQWKFASQWAFAESMNRA